MKPPAPAELIAQVRALPAAVPLARRLAADPGVHLVGGAVRDLLRGQESTDLDLVVEGDAASIARRLGGEVRFHDRFGTSTVTLGGFTYDIAQARAETYSRPGALPDVRPATLAEDLLRRDFTVNAAAIELGGPRAGELQAAPGALEDLDAGRLRVLHEESFNDDPTRLLRLARYAARLHFSVEPQTRTLAANAVRDGAIRTVSGPRIGSELRLLARERDPIGAFVSLGELEVDRAIHPGFGLREPALAAGALDLLGEDEPRDLLLFAVAFREIAAEQLAVLLDGLAFEGGDRDQILSALTRAPAIAASLERARSRSQIAAAVAGGGAVAVALAGAIGPHEPAREWLSALRAVRLEIDGSDLLAAGIPEGPAVGRGLRAALAGKLDGHLRGREAELAEALRAARSKG